MYFYSTMGAKIQLFVYIAKLFVNKMLDKLQKCNYIV